MTKIILSKADAGKIQDAWHYATLIIHRENSTFNGDREYPEGIRGQLLAYEHLLVKIDEMAADNETWQLVKSQWWKPETVFDVLCNAGELLSVINETATQLGIEARTGEKL